MQKLRICRSGKDAMLWWLPHALIYIDYVVRIVVLLVPRAQPLVNFVLHCMVSIRKQPYTALQAGCCCLCRRRKLRLVNLVVPRLRRHWLLR